MPSNASRGAQAKSRTKKWLIAKGYQVGNLEEVRWVFKPDGGGRIPVKRDQFGSDLLAVSAREIVFVQVKSGASAATGRFPEARRRFADFRFPPNSKQWVVAWAPRAREPRIVDMTPLPDLFFGPVDGATE